MPPRNPYDQLRVIANPQEGLVVLDAKGNHVQVFAANIALRAGKPPIMQMNMLAQPFSVQGTPTFMVQDPATGEPKAAKRIEWFDGTVAEFPEPPAPGVTMQEPAGGAPNADPSGAAPITPGVMPVSRSLVDVPAGHAIPSHPIDLPPPPDGKRWETDDELRDRILTQGVKHAG